MLIMSSFITQKSIDWLVSYLQHFPYESAYYVDLYSTVIIIIVSL